MSNSIQILKDNIACQNQSFFNFLTGNWNGRFEVYQAGTFNMTLFKEYINVVASISFEDKQEFLEGIVDLHHKLLNSILQRDRITDRYFVEPSLITDITEVHYSLLKSFFKNDEMTQKSVSDDLADLVKYSNDINETRFTIIPLFQSFLDGEISKSEFLIKSQELSTKYNRTQYWSAYGIFECINEEVSASLINGEIDNTLLIDIVSQNLDECKKRFSK
jgi:hypothetical protein